MSVWAKASRTDDASMSLPRHLSDAAAVAGHLWDGWVPASVRATIAAALPGGPDDGRLLVTWLAGIHDVGKASPAFAVQVEETAPHLTDAMRRQGLDIPYPLPDRRLVRHELAGHHAVSRWLVDTHGFRPRTAATYAVAVGGHHGAPPNIEDLKRAREMPRLVGRDSWTAVRTELLDHVAERTGASGRLADWSRCGLPVPVQVVVGALVILADWLASDEELFPYEDPRPSAERAADAWARAGLSPPWRVAPPPADTAELFAGRFALPDGSRPRPVQEVVLDVVHRPQVPGLVVVEAPMGEGKTEAALAAAEVLAHRTGAGGLFVALPTTATSDAMFTRVRDWVERLPATDGSQALSLHLAHGKAALNRDARSLPRGGGAACVAADGGGRARSVDAVADQWLHGRKRGPLASVVVGTIDQVVFAALKSKHLVLRHLALAGKVVVIDEVHAVDIFMGSYLQRALHWLAAHGVPVVLLSATLADGQRRSLVEAYASGATGGGGAPEPITALPGPHGYPAVTSWSSAGVEVDVVPVDSSRRRSVALHRLADDDEALVDLLRTALADGGCAAVVRNTVSRAMDTHDLLVRQLAGAGYEVLLVHSRFVAADRARRERDLAERLGPERVLAASGRQRPQRFVVIGTQVIEQSLDIDVDVMVTDLAPVDLVLQRIGRLHRHPRGREQADRPAPLRSARCYVSGVEDWAASPPAPVRGSRTVYRDAALLRSLTVLSPLLDEGSLTLPDDIAPLVQDAYSDALEVPQAWHERFEAAEEDRRRREVKQARRAEDFQLAPVAPAGGSLVGWLADAAGEADDAGRGVARVRDTEDSIEVVLVQRSDGEVRLLPWVGHLGGSAIATDWRPEDRVARVAATCTLRLPLQLSNARTADDTIRALERTFYPGWQDSPWLSGQLVLKLDEDFSAELAGHHLTYHPDRGLLVERSEGAR